MDAAGLVLVDWSRRLWPIETVLAPPSVDRVHHVRPLLLVFFVLFVMMNDDDDDAM